MSLAMPTNKADKSKETNGLILSQPINSKRKNNSNEQYDNGHQAGYMFKDLLNGELDIIVEQDMIPAAPTN